MLIPSRGILPRKMASVKHLFISTTVLVVSFVALGCENLDVPYGGKKAPPAQPEKAPDLSMPNESIRVWDAKLRLGVIPPEPHDMRFPYVVQGRITNKDTSRTVGKVGLRITMADKTTWDDIDSEEISLKMSIPPKGTQAFAYAIRLLPPDNSTDGFEWNYEVTSVEQKR